MKKSYYQHLCYAWHYSFHVQKIPIQQQTPVAVPQR